MLITPTQQLADQNSKVPDGYVFVPKGDVYITRHWSVFWTVIWSMS